MYQKGQRQKLVLESVHTQEYEKQTQIEINATLQKKIHSNCVIKKETL